MKSNKKQIVAGLYETYIDGEGQQIIDLSGGFGFQIPEVIDAVKAQAELMGLSNRVLMSEPLIDLCRRLAGLLPEPLVSSYVCSSGDEAFEGALKLCKGLNPKRNTLVFIKGGDYGSLTYGRSLTHPDRYSEIQRLLGFKRVAINHPAELESVDWNDCFAVCHTSVRTNDQGTLKLIEQPLLDRLYAAAKDVGAPVVAMDVNTCLGSLGRLFGFQHYANVPDIAVLGGALSGSAVPIGTYTCSEKMAYAVYGRSTPAKHGSTTAGNPMACIAAMTTLDYVQTHKADQRCTHNGELLVNTLKGMGATALGAWVSVPLQNHDEAQLRNVLYRKGVYVSPSQSNALILRCPITARPHYVERAGQIIKETFSNVLNHAA
ncbi:aminotransferase class III-fold pyridoxal phosphate-dependent enzyme [Pseudomonas capsici]|uniref:aminotransferase class III-fold pyridoxal phosphate-dependent enzyme n=1 Tax=Pseudomonas capsici TaxID=2810614 RepID=UPI000E3E67F7|nr:aminotransferase class III-fold pyridoxal phosphate-dependent enzyme [Pseudomonas capsici]MCV4265624.1 aminotransferase class III-fold pyridoxal phosphate-dependent enzyme [Pseudomonas capsici]